MDLCFANEQNHKLIQQLYPVYQFQISFGAFHHQNLQTFVFSLEKLENIVQVRICDVYNQNKMFLCTIDNVVYQDIKTEQSLQVNFQGFIDHLITILDSCRKNELFISLIQNQSAGYTLQFYEKRSLKNLVHLFLRLQEAQPAVVMYHLNFTLKNVKEELDNAKKQNKILENEVNKKEFHLEQLQNEISQLKSKITENENMILHRNTEEVKRLNQEIKNIETSKEFEENRLRTLVKSFEAKIDQMTKENYTTNEKLMLETKKYDTLRNELDDMKKKLSAMSADNNRLKANLNQFDGKDKQQRTKIDEIGQQMTETMEKLRQANKEKSNLQAELDAEKQICQTKKRALQIATDELSKNHETIRQSEKNVEKLKKCVEWRSLVMLRMNDEIEKKSFNVEMLNGVKLS